MSAQVVQETDAKTLQGFVADHAASGATVYTDDAKAYRGMPFKHEAAPGWLGSLAATARHASTYSGLRLKSRQALTAPAGAVIAGSLRLRSTRRL